MRKLALFLLAGFLAIAPAAHTSAQTKTNCYPATGIVRSQKDDLVSVKLSNGEIFDFYADPGDYKPGDMCLMIMGTNWTDDPFDDIIIDAVNIGLSDR